MRALSLALHAHAASPPKAKAKNDNQLRHPSSRSCKWKTSGATKARERASFTPSRFGDVDCTTQWKWNGQGGERERNVLRIVENLGLIIILYFLLFVHFFIILSFLIFWSVAAVYFSASFYIDIFVSATSSCSLMRCTTKLNNRHREGIGNMRKRIIQRHNLQTGRTNPTKEWSLRCQRHHRETIRVHFGWNKKDWIFDFQEGREVWRIGKGNSGNAKCYAEGGCGGGQGCCSTGCCLESGERGIIDALFSYYS